MSAVRENIQFQSGHEQCAGWLYKADPLNEVAEKNAPCIVMAHGFAGTKQMRLWAYAEKFCAAGYNVLAFDYRHFGDSDGAPRQLLDIKKQHEDWHAALKFARSLKGVDLNKIVLWGTSFSGGHVMQIAYEDMNVAAVIAQVPHTSGVATAKASGFKQNFRLGVAAVRDAVNSVLGKTPYYVNVVGEVGELAAMTGPGERDKARQLYPENENENEIVAARVFFKLGNYSPGKYTSKLPMPLLVQVAMNDITTPAKPGIEAANNAPYGELITYDLGHFEVYVEPHFQTTVKDQLNFLNKVIG